MPTENGLPDDFDLLALLDGTMPLDRNLLRPQRRDSRGLLPESDEEYERRVAGFEHWQNHSGF